MKLNRSLAILALSAFALGGCDDDSTGPVVADLQGEWTATNFAYTDAENQTFSLDAVEDAGGEVTLDVAQDGSFTGTLMIPGLTQNPANPSETLTIPIGGRLELIDDETLRVDFNGNTEGLGFFSDFDAEYTLDGDVLTWTNEDTTFDFPDDIEESAGIGARGEVDAILTARFTR